MFFDSNFDWQFSFNSERDPATLTSNRTFVENIGERTISIAAILKELGMEKYADIIENVGFDLKAMAGMDYGCLDGLDIDDSDRSIIIRAFELYRDWCQSFSSYFS